MATKASVTGMEITRTFQPQIGPFPNGADVRVRNVGAHTIYLCSKSPQATSYQVEPRHGWPLYPGEILALPAVSDGAQEALFATTCSDAEPSTLRVLTSSQEG